MATPDLPDNLTAQAVDRLEVDFPFNDLFNISAYRPGDYHLFFQDARARYLKWAPMMLAAEEYHAGNPDFQPQEPVYTQAERERRRRR